MVMGGANDISKREANIGIKHLGKFIDSWQNTNIMTVTATAPRRHDLQEISYVNRETEVFSRKLHQLVKTAGSVKTTQANLSTNDITLHGLQLNISGKEKMAELTGENIKKTNGKKRRNRHHSEMGRNSKGSY